MVIVERVCLIVADAIVVAVTIYHTYAMMKMSREANVPAPFSRMLLHAGQGTIKDVDRY